MLKIKIAKNKKNVIILINLLILIIASFSWLFKRLSKNELYNLVECQIFNLNSELVWSFPAKRCAFFKNGDFVASINNDLSYFNDRGDLVWKKDIKNHHQINLDGNDILVISEEFNQYKNQKIKFDKLLIVSREGKIKKQFYLSDKYLNWYPKHLQKLWKLIYRDEEDNKGVTHEFSHICSFYKIPKNNASKKNGVFKEGNYIITDYKGEIFILDSELKNKLWSLYKVRNEFIKPHDAQITTEGKLIFYFNNIWGKRDYTTLESLDLITNESKILYKDNPPELFFAWKKGGIQLLDNGNYLTSDDSLPVRGFEINPRTNQIIWSQFFDDMDTLQQVKRLDLSRFLRNSKASIH